MNYITEPAGVSPDRTLLQARPSEKGFDLSEFLQMFVRRKWTIIGIVLASLVLTYLTLSSVTPTYTTFTDVFLDTRQQRFTEIEAVLGDPLADKQAILSEIEIVRSRGVAERVIDQLQLGRDPEFNPFLQPPGVIAQLRMTMEAVILRYLPPFITQLFGEEAAPLTPEQRQAVERDATINAFLENLSVYVKGDSRVLGIGFSSVDPEKAARIANTLADTYILDQLESRYDATKRANTWLSGKLEGLRRQVSESEKAVEAYRQQAGLLEGRGGTIVSQQVSDLSAQRVVAATERAAAEARLSQLRRLVQSAGGAEAAADVLQSPIIQALLNQETEVKRKVAELSQEYGDRHPRLISARAELKDVQGKIGGEVNKVIRALENEVGVARAREASIQQALQQLEARLAQANASGVQLRALEREAEANKAVLENFLSRSEEISTQSDVAVQQSNARVLSRAVVPQFPTSPKKGQVLALIFMASTVFAVLVVLAIEMLDRGYRSGEQIEEMTGLRSLGLVPRIKGFRRKSKAPQAMIVNHPGSLFGESVRSVYTSILVSQTKPAPKSIMITSSQPREGKTTLAMCLGRMCALSGKKTVIVEGDLRKPGMAKLLNVPQAPGLVEFFLGETAFEQILHKDEKSGAYVLPAGKLPVEPAKLIESPEMATLITALADRFDYVIIDSPPIMAVSDARVLAPLVDTTVFVVRWASTNREVVRSALKSLIETGGRVAGVVLTQVDAEEHGRYGFGDSGYYYKGVKAYYARS